MVFNIDVNNDCVMVHTINTNDTLVFSVNDEIFEMLENDMVVNPIMSSGAKNDTKKKYSFSEQQYDCKTKCKVVYQQAGVYFSLLAKVWKGSSINYDEIGLDAERGSYTSKKSGATKTYFSSYNIVGTDWSYSFRPYSKARGLKQFELTTTFSCEYPYDNYMVYKMSISI